MVDVLDIAEPKLHRMAGESYHAHKVISLTGPCGTAIQNIIAIAIRVRILC